MGDSASASPIVSVGASVSTTLARAAVLPGPVFIITGRTSWLKPSPRFPEGLQFWDAKDCQQPFQTPGTGMEGEGKRRAKCQLYFSRTGHSGSPLLALFPPLLMKLIMNTARGHLTPEIHVKIKYFRNTSI